MITVTTIVVSTASCVTQPWVKPVESPDVEVGAAALERHVRALAEDFFPRSVENPAQLQAAGDYVLAQMRAAGATPEIQDVEADGTAYRNFIARFGPAQGPLLVIGAHYDSSGQTPGADDNASGVAGLLELTRLLARNPPPRPVELVAYTLEEPPFFRTDSMGSFWHARELDRRGREVRLMVSLEMIGYYRDGPGTQSFPVAGLGLLYPDEGNFIAVVGAWRDFGTMRRVKALFKGASDLPVVTINAPESVSGVDFSDHASYWRFDMPALMVTDTAFLRNPNYHEAGDTAATLDYARMAKVVRAMHAVAMQF
jgi:Zn-dependent M28 family amino/carboxypeptidase